MATTANLLLATIAVSLYALNPESSVNIVGMGVLLQLSYALDLADGTVARLTAKTSLFGAWYDLVVDRVSHFIVTGGVMIILWPHMSEHCDYLIYHMVFGAYIALTMSYSSALNLRACILPSALPPGGSGGSIRATVGSLLRNACDYGVLLLVLTVALLGPLGPWPLIVLGIHAAIHAVALMGLIVVTPRHDCQTTQASGGASDDAPVT